MIYTNTYYETRMDCDFKDGKWFMNYKLVQGRANEKGIWDERYVIFRLTSSKNYDSAYKEIMTNAMNELFQYGFDLFTLPDEEYVSLKGRLDGDGKTKDNQIA